METLPLATMPLFFSGASITSWGRPAIGGIISNNLEQFQGRGLSKPVGDVTQYITLGRGSKINHLDFTGGKCVLTLQGTAVYNGAPHEKLQIIRV